MPGLTTLLLQIVVILTAARVLGWIFRAIHQPQVIGEMVAGILLGPSLLGWLAPGISGALFPPTSLNLLNAISQVGLIVFMFLVGLEFNPKNLRGKEHTAVVTSHASIIFPFLLGSALALYLYPKLSDDGVKFTHFALFMGTAMSITAFPVLARILRERNLVQTPLGALAISCAAVDDISAWIILAGVVLLVRSSSSASPLWLALILAITFIGAMLFVVRPLARRIEVAYHKRGKLTQDMLALSFLIVMMSAWVTELLGLHALIGAFLAGVVMPKGEAFVQALLGKLEYICVVLLLPLFFAFTGLRTRVGLVQGGEMWFYCLLICAVAIAGKFGGATLAAAANGTPWRESAALGVLLNTRGLIELVVLNIGLDIGVISPALFAMLVLMALLTTFLTTPLLVWIYRPQAIQLRDRVPTFEGATAIRE
jgi:Kef-type K+ transport system membrane component KefB